METRTYSKGGLHEIVLFDGKTIVGTIEYEIDDEVIGLGEVKIEEPTLRRKGFGTELVRKFVAAVGHGKKVETTVTNEPTWETLKHTNYLAEAMEEPVDVPQEEARALPISKVLQAGGIQVDQMTITATGKVADGMTYEDILKQVGNRPGGLSAFFSIEIQGTTVTQLST